MRTRLPGAWHLYCGMRDLAMRQLVPMSSICSAYAPLTGRRLDPSEVEASTTLRYSVCSLRRPNMASRPATRRKDCRLAACAWQQQRWRCWTAPTIRTPAGADYRHLPWLVTYHLTRTAAPLLTAPRHALRRALIISKTDCFFAEHGMACALLNSACDAQAAGR